MQYLFKRVAIITLCTPLLLSACSSQEIKETTSQSIDNNLATNPTDEGPTVNDSSVAAVSDSDVATDEGAYCQ